MNKPYFLLVAIFLSLFFISCDNDDNGDTGDPEIPSGDVAKYVIAATPTASEGVADYLLTVDDLTGGVISTQGNGVEQDGTYRYYVTSNNKFYSLLYGQGNPGAVTTYVLDADGELEKISDFQSETVQAFAPIGDEILLAKISRNIDEPFASWYRLSTESNQFVGEGQINTEVLANNGEVAFFTWITEVDGKAYMPYMSVKACCNDRFGTSYPDSGWIAVFDYPSMEFEKVITDDRISGIGRYFTNGLSVDEKGDVYAVSSAVSSNNGELTASNPGAIVRINSGEDEFDPNYFFDLEQASGGYYPTFHVYAGQGKFVLNMEAVADRGTYSTGKKYAIADVYNKTFTWVTGLPDADDIVLVTSRNNFASADGKTVAVGITTQTSSYVYNIDIATATATQGLEVQGGKITAIHELSYTE